MGYILGFDIGGTKCAVILAKGDDTNVEFIERQVIKTIGTYKEILDKLSEIATEILANHSITSSMLDGIGISCGGPLDSKRGVILSPPNLIGWNEVYITDYFEKKFGVPAKLKNDADACAVAEWKYGAGKGYENVIFLTFGTGLGAGLILNSKLYTGACSMAGEVGHIRLCDFGPVGYGKSGSFEGFCSGSGIKQLGQTMAMEKFQLGQSVSYCKDISMLDGLNAKIIADYADAGNDDAAQVYYTCGEYLGKGLSVIINTLNPDVIVLGGIYTRSRNLLEESMDKVLRKECLAQSYNACKVKPALLGEKIGDYATIVASFDV